MHRVSALRIVIIILFVIIMASLIGFWLFYREYSEKTLLAEQRIFSLQEKLETFGSDLASFKKSMEKFEYKFSKYSDTLDVFEEKLKNDHEDIKEVSAKIDFLSTTMHNWQKDYVKALLDVSEKVETIKDNINRIDNETISSLQSDVDSIKKQIKTTQAESVLDIYEKGAK